MRIKSYLLRILRVCGSIIVRMPLVPSGHIFVCTAMCVHRSLPSSITLNKLTTTLTYKTLHVDKFSIGDFALAIIWNVVLFAKIIALLDYIWELNKFIWNNGDELCPMLKYHWTKFRWDMIAPLLHLFQTLKNPNIDTSIYYQWNQIICLRGEITRSLY